MSKLLTRSLQLEREVKNREHTPYGKGIESYLALLPLVVWTKGYSPASKQLLLGLTVAMEGIIKGESEIGIFSKDFEKISEGLAHGLLVRAGEEEESLEMKERLLSRLILGLFAAFIGLVDLAKENAKERLTEEGADFFTTLLARAAIASKMPRETMKSLAEAMELDSEFTADALESALWILFLISNLPGEADTARDDLFEALREPLLNTFIRLDRAMEEGRFNSNSVAPLNTFLKGGKALLTQRNLPGFLKEFNKLLTAYKLSEAHLNEDLAQAKALFRVLKDGFSAPTRGTKSNITFIG